MLKSNISVIKKSIVVAAALITGVLMPYLSRIPLSLTYGTQWIWKFMPNADAFKVWNGFHLVSLAPVLMFGLVYIFGKMKWGFYAAVFAHLTITFLCYYRFEETYQRDDFLSFLLFPFIIGAPSVWCGLIGLFAESYINRRSSARQFA